MVLSFARKGYLACVLSMLAIGMSLVQCKLDSIQHLDEVTVTARSFSFKEVIPSQKLSGKELQNLNSHTVADALRYFSGVQLKDYGGVGGIKTVNIRSMGTNHMGVFYDGIELERYFPIRKRFRCGRYALSAFSSSSFRRWKNNEYPCHDESRFFRRYQPLGAVRI